MLEDNPAAIEYGRQLARQAEADHRPALAAAFTRLTDQLEHTHRIAVGAWQPISTCPENTAVMFGWADGYDHPQRGRMQRNVKRFGGQILDHYWGYAGNDDDHPPTHWQPAIEGPHSAA